jgi:hypothetical protein
MPAHPSSVDVILPLVSPAATTLGFPSGYGVTEKSESLQTFAIDKKS